MKICNFLNTEMHKNGVINKAVQLKQPPNTF